MRYSRFVLLLVVASLLSACANVRQAGPREPVPRAVSPTASSTPTASATPSGPSGPPGPPANVLLDVSSGAVLSALPGGVALRNTENGDSDESRPTMLGGSQDPDAAIPPVTDRAGRFAVYAAGPRDDLRVVVQSIPSGRKVDVGGPLALCLCDAPSTPRAAPIWSPSDNFFAYISGAPARPETLRVVVVDVRSMTTRTLDYGSSLPGGVAGMIWQPNRDVLVYVREGDVYTYNAVTGVTAAIGKGSYPRFRTADLVQYRSSAVPTPGNVETVLYNVTSGREVARVAHVGFPLDFALLTHTNGIRTAHQPVWSQDGSTLAVTRVDGAGATSVILIDSATGKERVHLSGLQTPDACNWGWTYELRWATGDRYVQVETTPINCGV